MSATCAPQPQVSDFGLSKVLYEQHSGRQSASSTGGARNARWVAPEVLQGGAYTREADIYSFGVVMWELLTMELPFAGSASSWEIAHIVVAGGRPAVPPLEACRGLPAAAYQRHVQLMEECWHQDARKRPPFTVITGRAK